MTFNFDFGLRLYGGGGAGGGAPGILSNFTVTPAEGGSTASISVNVDSDEGTVYFVVVPSGSAVPSEAQIKAGTDGGDTAATWSGSAAVTAVDTYVVGPTGLTAETDYVAYAVHEDLTPAYSNIVTDDFTTLAAPADPDFAINALFESQEEGVWYDFSDGAYITAVSDLVNLAGYPSDMASVAYALDKRFTAGGFATRVVNAEDITTWADSGTFDVFSDNGDGSFSAEKTTASGVDTAYTNSLANLDLTQGQVYLLNYTVENYPNPTVNGGRWRFGSTTNARTTAGRYQAPAGEGTFTDIIVVTTNQLNASIGYIGAFVEPGGYTARVNWVDRLDGMHTLLYSGGSPYWDNLGETYPRLRFESTDKMLSYAGDTLNLSANDDVVIFAVIGRTQNAADARLFEHGSTVKILADAPDFTNGNEYTFSDGTASLAAQSVTTPEKVVLTYIRTRNGSATLRVNGVQQDTGTAGTAALENAALYLGSSSVPDKLFNGDIYEFIIRNAATSLAQIEAVEARLTAKHGVA